MPLLDPTKKSFLDHPYEIRLEIYKHLLINQYSPEDQATVDAATSRTMKDLQPYQQAHICGRMIYRYAINLGHRSDTKSKLGGTDKRRYPFICNALGLLLTNSIIHKEAVEVLYSSNTFTVTIASDERESFWSEGPQFDAKFPHTVPRAKFALIQHLDVFVRMVQATFSDHQTLEESARNAFENLLGFVNAIIAAGNRLKTVRITLATSFWGEIGIMGEYLEARSGRPVDMKEIFGDIYRFIPSHRGSGGEHDIDRLYQHITKALEPLKLWHRLIEQSVTFRGDIPSHYATLLENQMLKYPATARGFVAADHRCQYRELPEHWCSYRKAVAGAQPGQSGHEEEEWYLEMSNRPRCGPRLWNMIRNNAAVD